MSRRFALIVGLLALGALVAVWAGGCGGGDNSGSAQTVPTTPPLTVPGETKPPKIETTPAETTTGETTPAGGTGGQSAPQTPSQQPQDTQTHDTPPPKGSPAARFEQFCKENPGAC